MSSYREKLIQDLYDLHVSADITIEELADDILDDIRHLNDEYSNFDCDSMDK